jgi:sugar lactone lactonase YvrE
MVFNRSNDRDGVRPEVVAACLLLLMVGLTCAATDPQMVEPGYWLEQVYEPSLVVPNHIAVSPSGIIVATEWSEGKRVVRIHEDGSLSTYAQPSSGHHFGVIFDAADNLYVGDGPNNLWRVSPTGEVTLVAEDVFGFNLDIGPSGNVYALGGENACVQRITPAGNVSVYAEGFVGASELAVCPITEEVFVFDMLAGTIWRAVPGGAPVPLATGLIHESHSIAVAPDGTLYYAEMGHLYTVSHVDGTLTEVDWFKEISTGLGIGTMDFDSSGRLVSAGGSCIARLDMDAETAEVLWHGYGHSHALGVAPDGGGVYIGSTSPLLTIPGCVVRLEPGGSATPFVEGLLPEVCGFVVKTTDLGYVVSSRCDSGVWTSVIHEVDMATGAKTEYAILPTHGHNLTIDPATGFLWGLVDGISYFDASDVRHSLFPSSEGIGVESIAFTPDGTLYITGYTTDMMAMPVDGALYRVDDKYGVDPSYVAIADLSTIVMCCPLGNIAVGMDGNIYWVGHGDHYTPGNGRDMHMLRITPGGDVTLIGHQFPMDPFAITADPDSLDLYFTSGNGVYRVYQDSLTEVVFPDAGLKGAIRDAVGKPTGVIYDWDLVGLSSLNAGDRASSISRGFSTAMISRGCCYGTTRSATSAFCRN